MIDTQSKRMSALLEGLVLPLGALDAAERAAAAWLYNGNWFFLPSAELSSYAAIRVGPISSMGDGPTIGGM